MYLCEIEVSLVYVVSSRPAEAAGRLYFKKQKQLQYANKFENVDEVYDC